MSDVVPICRVCLVACPIFVDFNAQLPTESGNAENLTYLQCFKMSTQIMNVQSNENICETCANELLITFNFLEKAKRAEQILLEFTKSTEQHDDIETATPPMDAELEDWYGDDIEDAVTGEYHDQQGHEEANATCIENVAHENPIIVTVNDYITESNVDGEPLGTTIHTPNTSADDALDNPALSEDFSFEDHAEEEVDDPGSPDSHNPGTLKCYDCNAIFTSLPMRRRHQWRCHKIMATCRICLTDVPINKSMLNHMLRNHAHVRKCKHCDFVGRDDKVVTHERTVHETDTQYQCQLCEKSFSYLSYVSHLRSNCRRQQARKSDACEVCDKTFSTNSYLRQHMELHVKKREVYACQHCEKRYLTKNSLEIHMRIHAGNTLKCPVCSKRFTRTYELRVHMRFHTGECPFECDVCHKRFAIKSHLRSHMWRHQGVKTQCDECGKLFASTKALHEHSFVHTGMPYPCGYCKRSFPTKQKIRKHLSSVHNVLIDDDELDRLMKGKPQQPVRRKKVTLFQAVDGDVVEEEQQLLLPNTAEHEAFGMDDSFIDEVPA